MPDKIKKINAGNLAFKLMENIELFTRAAKEYGLSDAEAFQTVDLWDGENLHQVCVCLNALGRKAQMNGLDGIGPKESARNERTFTIEQLNEGSKIISLQYGTNKLANQSGLNFGNTRHMWNGKHKAQLTSHVWRILDNFLLYLWIHNNQTISLYLCSPSCRYL